jgi:hypothetical protein
MNRKMTYLVERYVMVVEGQLDNGYIYADKVDQLTCQIFPDDNEFNQAWHPTFVKKFGNYRIEKFSKVIAILTYLSFMVFFWIYLQKESIITLVISIIHSVAIGKFFDYFMWYKISGFSQFYTFLVLNKLMTKILNLEYEQ